MLGTARAVIAGGVTSFKATDKKVVNQAQPQQAAAQDAGAGGGGEPRPWHGMRNLGDMEGTLDAWVLFASFAISLITAAVGVFQMVDKPFTAQVRARGPCSLCVHVCKA